MDSPFDVTNYLAFPSGQQSVPSQPPQQHQQQQHGQSHKLPAGNDDLYMAFARGIHENHKQKQQQQQHNAASPPTNPIRGKSSIVQQGMAASSPYGLDPSAFQSEVRFQMPAFLNPSAAAPAYPNGAEAYAGYGMNNANQAASTGWNNWTFKPETAPNPAAAMGAFFAQQQAQQAGASAPTNMMMQPPPPPQAPPKASSSTPFPSSSGNSAATAANLLTSGGLSGLVQPGTLATSTPSGANMPGLYSTTGFDIISILARVASRRDPKTVLGPVDCSCSFTVVDVRKFDNPIVYASPTFCQLTGYEAHEIVGRNCRFLQAPDGDVQRGSRRKYTDNAAVSHLKRMLAAGKECQASLINYRKGGMPFINLLTVVPLTWDSDEVVYHVGFQVDLVEQPNAILRNMRDGSYQVSYTALQSPQPPPAVKPPPAPKPPAEPVNGLASIDPELFKLMPSRLQDNVYNGPEDSGKMEWLKFAFENTDDFVHVLSLKGQFHYVSPSVRAVLEYEPEDLLNKHISDICHPSDIVPVMRELKDSTHSNTEQGVNLVFRVRRKHSGYVWLECHGRLHVEPGKGRKAVILTGRERSVSALTWRAVQQHGGLAETEFWAKLSFEGLWLWASSTYGQVLGDVKMNDLVGRSFYEYMGPASSHKAVDVAQAIRQAVSGLPKMGATSVRHTLNGRDVVTTFYAVNNGDMDPPLAPTPSDDDSPASTSASAVSRFVGSPTNQVLIQVKMIGGRAPQKRLFDTVVHPLSENVFEEMDTTRGTSWQYEMHQLKISNRKLENEIKGIRNGTIAVSPDESSSDRPKNKKRKSSMLEPARPSADHPAPLHQQTPGFGLAPGHLYKTWN